MKRGFMKEESRYDFKAVMGKKDFEGIVTFEKHKKKNTKELYSNRVVDELYRSKIRKIDRNLNEL